MRLKNSALRATSLDYTRFELIDGTHPYKSLGEQGFVPYQVFKLNKGTVVYFNFKLAKEMGLIPKLHSHQMNPELHEKLLETFSIQIINEYDQLKKKRIPKEDIKKNDYMATRYLQLQHKSKLGLTSGDGRSIWNGYLEHKGKCWDISSRGTGVTILSPGASALNKPLKTGNTETGYGCGQAEIDELIGSAIMSEVLYEKGLETERVLCVIDLGKGVGIGVRAGQNLLRPAHAFLFLKQTRYNDLKKVIDYHIHRQVLNKKMTLQKHSINKYDQFLNHFVEDLAKFTAFIEENYIFVWLDWDGDNLLMDAGIIDYGSIRHFGTCHNKYRYDDVDRYSTNLLEQKFKARLLIKEMAQAIDFIKTGVKKPLDNYTHHQSLKKFNALYKQYSLIYFSEKIGLSKEQTQSILKNKKNLNLLKNLKKEFYFWENIKTSKGKVNVPDGINFYPLINMRSFAKEVPHIIHNKEPLKLEDFFNTFQTQFSTSRDKKIVKKYTGPFKKMLALYKQLFKALHLIDSKEKIGIMTQQLNSIHSDNFLTGNSLIHSVDDILNSYLTTKSPNIIQNTIDKMIDYSKGEKFYNRQRHFISVNSAEGSIEKKLWDKVIMNLHEYREDI